MRLKYILSLLLLFVSISWANAQTFSSQDISKVKVDQLSDAQIMEINQRLEDSGLSEEQALKLLIERGLDPAEGEKFRKRLQDIKTGGKSTTAKQNTTAKDEKLDYGRDTTKIPVIKPIKKPSPVYGLEIFNNPNLKFEPNVRIATPKSYVLGPDDEVNVIFTGLNERSVTAKISPDGNLRIPYIGLVYLNGFTIDQAYAQIKSKAQKIYPALASGQTKLNISLGNVRSIQVTIIGEVNLPGTYTISSLSSLFNALYQSGGPNRKGSLRNIELIRANKLYKTVDLYAFLQKGILSDNASLRDLDVIRVPIYKKRVAVDGEIQRPGLYELKADETIADLITYAGGFADNAFKGIAKVSQVGDKELSVKDVPSDLFDRYVLKNADSIYFGKILARYTNRINVQGAVYRPGTFELTEGATLKSIITKAEGLRDDASLDNGYIKRTNPNLDKEMISFNLGKVMSGANADIPLLREDTVVIVSRQSLKDNLNITVGGNVRLPGSFTYRKGMSVSDAIAMSNGFTFEAAAHRVEISRLVKDTTNIVANQLLETITLDLDSTNRAKQGNFILEPLDYIYVPRLVNYRSLGNVQIAGEILYPGSYPLLRRDETGVDFINRVGGITPIGSLENAQVYRDGIRLAVNLKTDKKDKINGFVLMQGDSIYVPRRTPYVEVVGAVNNPQMMSFVSNNFIYYVNAAGGLAQNGMLKGAYLQYPNGINQPVKSFLFFRNYPKVVPGSKIVVPKNNGIKVRLGVGEVSTIASALTALVTVIAVLIK